MQSPYGVSPQYSDHCGDRDQQFEKELSAGCAARPSYLPRALPLAALFLVGLEDIIGGDKENDDEIEGGGERVEVGKAAQFAVGISP